MSIHQMRGASARSLKATVAAVESVDAEHGTVGAELFGVVGVFDSAPALRRILTDPSTDDEGRATLATKVLSGKVSDATLSVVSTAVKTRWSAGRDLVDALEVAGVIALTLASDGSQLETELFEIGQVIRSSPELRSVLNDRAASGPGKLALIKSVFGAKVSASALALAQQATAARKGSFDRALEAFGAVIAEQRERSIAVVRSAYALTEDEQKRLAEAISAKFDRAIHLNLIVDPHVLGGLSVTVGPDVIDSTMSTRLETARRQLAG